MYLHYTNRVIYELFFTTKGLRILFYCKNCMDFWTKFCDYFFNV